ncbi:hypothetical protein EDD28_2855 [Salana multivorans]|uniref:Uncharacterized protein n=1 Tax=Salana multivorans TaxID=120377 RepID=A0A3N2D0Z1_9MICO|nr:hypothetical protein [Salana multivorans]OJX94252.1 MAG: hypothetical protein BGO96_15075 [Micrococcales bacterium 73-15]ROR93442.1 hypothetical protein EDD28_2855 [Salana multivorans]
MTAAVLLLSGCASPLPGFPGSSATPHEPTSTGSAGLGDIPQGFIECHGEPPKDGELVADVDLTKLTAPTPPGFRTATGYHEDNPVEGASSGQFWVPVNQLDTLDVASINVYPQMELGPLAVTCDEISWREIVKRIEQYHEINGAQIIEETTRSSVAGMPAVREEVSLPDSGYDYIGWWIFGRGQLAHVYCQWTSEAARQTLVDACDTLAATIVVE